MASKPNKRQVTNKVIKLILDEELDNTKEAIDYLHQNKHVSIKDFLDYLEQYKSEVTFGANELYRNNQKLFEVVAKGFGAQSLVYLIEKFTNSNEVLAIQKFFKNPSVANASENEKEALNSSLLKKYASVRSNYNYFKDFLSFIDGLDGEFLAKEMNKEYKDDSADYIPEPHLMTSICRTIRQYKDYIKKDSEIFVLSDICNNIFNKVAQIDKNLPQKFLSENLTNATRFTNIIYSTSLEDLQYFIDSNNKFLNDDLINTIKSNSILKQCFSTKEISDKNYSDGVALISNNKFEPSLNYFENYSQMLEGKALPQFNTKNFELSLQILKTNKLPTNFNSVSEGDKYSEAQYTSTAFEIFINKGIKDISNIAYDNALSKSNSLLSKAKPFKSPSASMIKESLLETSEKFLESANKLIELGFEPVISNSSISQINESFVNQLKGQNIKIVNHDNDDEYRQQRNQRDSFNAVRHMMDDLARDLRVDPRRFMMLADYLEDAMQPVKDNKDEKKSIPEPTVDFAHRESCLLTNWNHLMKQVTRLTPEQKEARKVKPKM